jgi:heme exporter protein A
MAASALLTADRLCKSFAQRLVFKDLSFSITSGECVLLLGGNGAGKSTLLRGLAGLQRFDAGTLRLGEAPTSSTQPERNQNQKIQLERAFLGHQSMLYARLSVRENLQLALDCAQGAARFTGKLTDHLEVWNLAAVADRQVHELSKGTQMRAALARGLLLNPDLILLDEPTASLDSRSVELLLSALRTRVQAGASVLLATHDLARVQELASRAVLLAEGILALDSAELVRAQQASSPAQAIGQIVERYHLTNR